MLVKTKADLQNSEKRAGAIYDELKILNQKLVAIKGEFELSVQQMKGKIDKRMDEVQKEKEDAELAAIKAESECGWAEMIFTLNIACVIKAKKAERAMKAFQAAGVDFVQYLRKMLEEFEETKRVLGMCAALMQSTQDQRVMMNEFKTAITGIIEGVNQNLDSLGDLVDPDIGPDMIQL